MSKYIVVMEDGDSNMMEIEATSAADAAEKFANDPDNDIQEDEILLVCEKFHRFTASFKRTVKPVPVRKGKSEPIA